MFGRSKIKNISNVEWKLCPPEEKPAIGKVSEFTLSLTPSEGMFFHYVAFELINERTDKRAPMDRLTSRSRYLFRYNVDQEVKGSEETTHKFPIRVPIHKEPSRNDKFICIKWQLNTQIIFSKDEESKDLLGTKIATMELDVV